MRGVEVEVRVGVDGSLVFPRVAPVGLCLRLIGVDARLRGVSTSETPTSRKYVFPWTGWRHGNAS